MTEEAERISKAYKSIRSFDERMNSRGFRLLRQERNDELSFLLAHCCMAKPLPRCRVLDFGSGSGDVLEQMRLQGATPELAIGVDVQPEIVAYARANHPGLSFVEVDGEHLPFQTGSFDIILAYTVFSSILNPFMAKRVATEVKRVLKSSGMILWYDMRYPNPWNPNIRAMTRSRIHSLFPSLRAELRAMTLIPPLAERLGALTETLYPILATVPLLRSHYFGMLRT